MMHKETVYTMQEIPICLKKASSFPDGILEAHQSLHKLIKIHGRRRFFGLSRGDRNNQIQYWAGCEALSSGEAEQLKLEKATIKAGQYIAIEIKNFRTDIPAIGEAFRVLLGDGRIDQTGYCIEEYFNETDVRCMVRLKDGNSSD
jgi:hypothetical protein